MIYNPLTIKIKYRNRDTKRIDMLPNGDWIDLAIDQDVSMMEGDFRLVHLGVAMQLPVGYEAHIIPRSSTYAKYGIIQANSFGLIDNSYRGDDDWWMFPAIAMMETFIERGSRICQFRIVEKQPPLIFREYENFETSSRGGFGSTGI
jgi:dUTP pyrophosphatase